MKRKCKVYALYQEEQKKQVKDKGGMEEETGQCGKVACYYLLDTATHTFIDSLIWNLNKVSG